MSAYISLLNETKNKIDNKFAEFKNKINWVNTGNAIELESIRNKLLNTLASHINFTCDNTKPYYRNISKGCELCGMGLWSCLFITGVCNAKCFFCPAQQNTPNDLPSSQLKTFSTPIDYANYINFFNFKGVSFSGGEPLLEIDKTLKYIKTIRKHCNPNIYIWVYTNGILGTKNIYKELNNAGVNEIRFNLYASDFDVTIIEKAAYYFNHLTIEIPSIPEDYQKITKLLPTLINLGVIHFNLHALRLTHYNAPKLISKNYTFTHGYAPIAIESEIIALKIIKYAVDNNINIGINFCNFDFKYNFQKSGYRKILAQKLKKNYQEITQSGYLRTIKRADNLNNYICLKDVLTDLKNQNINLILNYEQIVMIDNTDEFIGEKLQIMNKTYGIIRVKKLEVTINAKLYIDLLSIKSIININDSKIMQIFQLEKYNTGFLQYY